jgi:hypothetical protein
MCTDIESAVRADFLRVMPELSENEVDLGADMVDHYGLTSLNKVLFLMSVCDSVNVGVATFTELDLAGMRTLEDVASAMAARRAAGSSVSS